MLESMSNILEACQPFTMDEFNEFTSSECNTSDRTFSCHFLNVDGNASNFDFLAAALHKAKFPFDVIDIAEINIKVECAHLYTLDGYSSLYQHKILRKKKGSGVSSIRNSSTTQNQKKHFTFPIERRVGCLMAFI